jgi:hypothetical protein
MRAAQVARPSVALARGEIGIESCDARRDLVRLRQAPADLPAEFVTQNSSDRERGLVPRSVALPAG